MKTFREIYESTKQKLETFSKDRNGRLELNVYITDDLNKIFEIKNGIVYFRNTLGTLGDVRNYVNDYIRDIINDLLKEQKVFFRFTDNKDEIKLVKNKELNNSRNYNTGREENGVSVSTHTGYQIQDYKYGYAVTGNVIGYGSDGEPLLDPKTMKPLSRMYSEKSFDKLDKIKEKYLIKVLKEIGMTREMYSAFMNDITLKNVDGSDFKR